MTTNLILEKVLNDDYFVVGEQKIIKWALSLVTHMVNRHLRFFSDLIDQSGGSSATGSQGGTSLAASSGGGMGTERLLFVVDDLHAFEQLVR